jgi:hypothetical protein
MPALDPPNLSVKHLRAIVALARFGSFIAAASHLRMSDFVAKVVGGFCER